MNIQIVIPIHHPDEKFTELLHSLRQQTWQDYHLLLLDSGSDKKYAKLLNQFIHAEIEDIPENTFNHGATRQKAIEEHPESDLYIFLTQDAVLANSCALENIIQAFDDARIGCAYGRQLPYAGADVFAAFARTFNYGKESHVRFFHDKGTYGIKTAFLSDSFAAYRKTAMEEVGGFPRDVILGEDMYVGAKMLLKGWGIGYVADAKAYHSHNYTNRQNFKRYFDTGAFHAREPWLIQQFGKAEGTGKRFIQEELQEIVRHHPFLLPQLLWGSAVKFAGYRLGLLERFLPAAIKKRLSMMPKYW